MCIARISIEKRVARNRAWLKIQLCSPLLIKFADRCSIQTKFDSPCWTNGFINHESFLSVFQSWHRRSLYFWSVWYKWRVRGSVVVIMVLIFEKDSYSCYSVRNSSKIVKKDPGCRYFTEFQAIEARREAKAESPWSQWNFQTWILNKSFISIQHWA